MVGSTKDRYILMGKRTFYMNKMFKTWGKSLPLQYANEAKF